MPLYEYRCAACDEVSELLQPLAAPAPERCPQCGAELSLRRLLSAHAVGVGSSSSPLPMAGMGPCGSCGHPAGPGACGMMG